MTVRHPLHWLRPMPVWWVPPEHRHPIHEYVVVVAQFDDQHPGHHILSRPGVIPVDHYDLSYTIRHDVVVNVLILSGQFVIHPICTLRPWLRPVPRLTDFPIDLIKFDAPGEQLLIDGECPRLRLHLDLPVGVPIIVPLECSNHPNVLPGHVSMSTQHHRHCARPHCQHDSPTPVMIVLIHLLPLCLWRLQQMQQIIHFQLFPIHLRVPMNPHPRNLICYLTNLNRY